MSTNMELITSVTVGSGGAASVTLPATGTIPATYTDLKIVASVRTEGTGSPYLYLRFNGSSTGYSNRRLIGDGTAISSSAPSDAYILGGICNTTDQTSNTFSSHDIYIPNYAGSNNKSVSVDAVTENNATSARAILLASLWSNSAAITSIVLTNEAAVDFAEGSTFYLYGISNVTSTTKATGGIVSSDGTYNYHMFPFSGTFTPTTAISADVLVIAGGGAGGYGGSGEPAGGGGAGGYLTFTSQSLTATGYTVTVGGGGAAPALYNNGPNGSNSQFGSLTAAVGGGGGVTGASTATAASTGGSGGGGNANTVLTGGSGTAGQGTSGGNGVGSPNFAGGGGGGASSAGASGASQIGGIGGAGSNSVSTWAIATQTGVNGYYAGGGAGGSWTGGNQSAGGLGGGGTGGKRDATQSGTSGTINTGSGGGGGVNSAVGGAGGSGLVIVRYAI